MTLSQMHSVSTVEWENGDGRDRVQFLVLFGYLSGVAWTSLESEQRSDRTSWLWRAADNWKATFNLNKFRVKWKRNYLKHGRLS